jgi:hypothetical protein
VAVSLSDRTYVAVIRSHILMKSVVYYSWALDLIPRSQRVESAQVAQNRRPEERRFNGRQEEEEEDGRWA